MTARRTIRNISPGPSALKALTHPDRLRMLGILRLEGPQTASGLAARLGLNSGATSYHLRQLAQHGFIEDAPELGSARDRWWRAAHESTHTEDDAPAGTPEAEMTGAYLSVIVGRQVEQILAAQARARRRARRVAPRQHRERRHLLADGGRGAHAERAAGGRAARAEGDQSPARRPGAGGRAAVHGADPRLPASRLWRADMTRRPFHALLLAQGAALLGTRLSMIAVPWLVLTELGDPLWAGIVAFAEVAPYVVAKAAGGPLIDRLGARRVSVWTDLLSVLALGAVPLLYAAGLLTPLALVPLMALVGALRGPADAAKYAMVPTVAEATGLALTRVTGLIAGGRAAVRPRRRRARGGARRRRGPGECAGRRCRAGRTGGAGGPGGAARARPARGRVRRRGDRLSRAAARRLALSAVGPDPALRSR